MTCKQSIAIALGLTAPLLLAASNAHASYHVVNTRTFFYGEPPDIVVPAGRYSEVRVPLLMTGLAPESNGSVWGWGYSVSAPGIWATRTNQSAVIASNDYPIGATCNDEMTGGDFPYVGFVPFVVSVSPAVKPGLYSLDLKTPLGYGNENESWTITGLRQHGGINIFVVDADQPGAGDIQFTTSTSVATSEIPLQHSLLGPNGNLQVSEIVSTNANAINWNVGIPWRLIYEISSNSWLIRAANSNTPFPAGTSFSIRIDGMANTSNNLLLVARGTPGSSSGNIMSDGCMQVASDSSDNNSQAGLLLTKFDQVSRKTDPSSCSSGYCIPVATYDPSISRWKVCHSDGTPYVQGERVMVRVLGAVADPSTMPNVISNALQMTLPGNGELARVCDVLSTPAWGATSFGNIWPTACSQLGASPWSGADLILTSVAEPVGVREQIPTGPYLSYWPGSSMGWTAVWGTQGGVGTPTPSGLGARLNPQVLQRTPIYSPNWEGTLGKYSSVGGLSLTTGSSNTAKDLGIWDFSSLSPLRDVAGRNPDATQSGQPTAVTGPNGHGAHFNGTSDAYYVDGLAPIGTDVTACVWYRANAADIPSNPALPPPRLLSFQSTIRHPLLQIAMNPGGKIGLTGDEGPSQAIVDTVSTADGSWHGIQMSRVRHFDGTIGFGVLVDGRNIGTVSGSITGLTPDGLLIAAHGTFPTPGIYSSYFKGDIAYVHVFDGAANCVFPNGAFGAQEVPMKALLSNWRNTTCGNICTSQTQSDRRLCYKYLDCYRDNSCRPTGSCIPSTNVCKPTPACALPDGICGVNGKPGGMAPKTIADQVYACLGGT